MDGGSPKHLQRVDYVIELGGCYPLPVVLEFDAAPEIRGAFDAAPIPAYASLSAIKTSAGDDILPVLRKAAPEFVSAIESDLAAGLV